VSVNATPNEVSGRSPGISTLILIERRFSGEGSIQIALAAASDPEGGQLSQKTVIPAVRKIRVTSASASAKRSGATRAELYTCTVIAGCACGERAKTGVAKNETPRKTVLRHVQQRGLPSTILTNSQDGKHA